MSTCTADKHLKNPDLFCNQCITTCCSKCFKSHSAHAEKIVDIDQILSESSVTNNIDGIMKFIEENSEKKLLIEETFKFTVEEEYQEEQQKITNYFKKLHDALHYREVDLKKELKSHFDDNQEQFVTMTSVMENNVKKCKEIIGDLDSNKDQDNSIKKFNEFKILNLEFQKQLGADPKVSPFVPYKFREVPLLEFDQIISRSIIKQFTNQGQARVYKNVYLYTNNSMQRFDFATKKLEKVDFVPMDIKLDSIWQSMCSTDTNLYIFSKKNWCKWDPETTKWTVKPLPNETDNGGYQPAFYDGKKHIYLLGGYKGTTFYLNVTRFNIETEEFEFDFAKLNSSHQNDPIIIDGDEKMIYLCGGYHNKDTDTLDVLNVDTKQVVTEHHFAGDGFPNVTTGCYIPATNSIYMITREYLFFRYDVVTKTVYKLATAKGNGYYNRLFFDGDNTMYLTSTNLSNIHEYNINTNNWTIGEAFHPSSAYSFAMTTF
ncbi:hypothetical protein DLAC_01615 [Tieghemostelium lacteum]|uniref:B box-type domain-containing protein n=1 Tax=Tieghemostelium lacteum TaxID=361077 RepID=A0A152A677_TIELA|nr:hypothetical protein DLAC_01615 [Tieghemostelium lacteum]|eukprot:KYR01615.1 hypothetical protein DLAC_01615 [Tieghemostelium lacteum]